MNRVQVLRDYNKWLKENTDSEIDFDSKLLDYLEAREAEFPSIDRDASVGKLGLSKRAYNCLIRGKITTIGQLMDMNDFELHNIRNMGKMNFDEVKEKLEEYRQSHIDIQ